MTAKNLILIVIDALRSDRLGCYENKDNLTPNIDSIADSGTIFKNCYSTFNATDPSFTTIFTGLFPITHGIQNHADRIDCRMLKQFKEIGVRTLTETLHENGYSTIGLDILSRWHKKGFDFYLGDKINNRIPTATSLADTAIERIGQTVTPFFLFIHFWDVHTPYNFPQKSLKKNQPEDGMLKIPDIFYKIMNPEWKQYLIESAGVATSAEEVIAAYDSAVQYVDQEVGRLMDFLKKEDLFNNSIIIITSDHGESLTEHEIFFDHHGLYDESIHVPLIFGNLVWKQMKLEDLVQHTSIVPTVYDLLGISYQTELFDGESLIPAFKDEKRTPQTFIISEESWTEKKLAIRFSRWKYIMSRSYENNICRYCGFIHGGPEELYDLISDPHENTNVFTKNPNIAKNCRDTLINWELRMKKKAERRKIKYRISKIRLFFKTGHG
jgi:arylsulfatase A-like enzyme